MVTFSCRVYRQVGVNKGGEVTEKVLQEKQRVLDRGRVGLDVLR